MQTVEKVYMFIFILIAAYLVLTSQGKINTVLGGLGGSITRTIIALQGGRGNN